MRKLLYTFAALAGILAVAASCQRETPLGSSPDGDLIDVSMNFTVDDGRPATKAISDGLTANKLTFLAYDEKGNYLSQLTPTNAGYENLTSKAGTVNLKVVKGMKYKFVFIASSENAKTNYFTLSDDKKTLTLSYTTIATAQKEDSDFFYHLEDNFAFSASGEAKGVTLKRPLAQLNVGSTAEDFTVASNSGIDTDALKTGYKLTSIPNKLNLLDGTVSGEADITLGTATRPSETLTVSSTNYAWVSMAYVLVGTGSQNTDVTLNVDMTNTVGEALSSIERAITAVPLKRNYRTNILGNIFSIDAMFNVSVDNAFEDNTNKLIGPSFASVSDLNTYFASFENNADNGNVNPEVVTLTDIPETSPATITLPKYAGNVQIRITAAYPGTVKVKYADSGDQPAHIDFYAANLHELETDIDNSHLTILSGSVIETGNFRTGSSTLEIMAGAKVGTANIKQGNAEIAGKVSKVDVMADATADGTNPVQVFVSKEAAIESITLNAKSDVVVEQPKDNIEVTETDKKVQVIVKATATGSSATAQKGGQIYVKVEGGAECLLTADGTSADDSTASSVYIAETGTGSTVYTETSDGGEIAQSTNPDDIQGEVEAYVAAIGEVKYTSLTEAFNAVADGETVVLLANLTSDAGFQFNKENTTAKLNLGKYTLTVKTGDNVNNRAIRIDNGTLEVYNGSIVAEGSGTTSSDGTGCYGAFRVEANGKLIAHDLSLKNSRPWGLNVKVLGGVAELTNVSITSTYGGGIEVSEADLGAQSQKGKATLTDCNFTQTGYFDHCSTTLSVSGGSELFVNSGSYTSDNYALYVFSSGGYITVNGGAFKATGDKAMIVAEIDTNTYPAYTGGLKLVGGDYFGTFQITSPASMSITGGTFNANPSEYVAEGYSAQYDETNENWVVIELPSADPTTGKVTVKSGEALAYVSNHTYLYRSEGTTPNHQLTIIIGEDLDMCDINDYSSFSANNYTSAQKDLSVLTIDGQKHTLYNMSKMLVSGTWAGKSGLVIKDLTIENADISVDGKTGVAAFCGYPSASSSIELDNCHLKKSKVSNNTGEGWLGGLIGYSNGYSGTDGPVFENIKMTNCSVTECTLTGSGSVGGIMGHATGDAWTKVVATNVVVTDNVIISTSDSKNKAGALFGTIGVAGSEKTTNGVTYTGGTYLYTPSKAWPVSDKTWSGNTVTSNNVSITDRTFGRVASTGGKYYINDRLVAHNEGNGDVIDESID